MKIPHTLNTAIVLVFTLTFFAGCATPVYKKRIDPSKDITIETGFLRDQFSQDGQPVSPLDLFEEGKRRGGESESAMNRADYWMRTSAATGTAGIFLVGASLFATTSKQNTLLLAGLGSTALSLITHFVSQGQFTSAVEAMNEGTGPKQRSSNWSVAPTLGIASSGHAGFGGLQIGF